MNNIKDFENLIIKELPQEYQDKVNNLKIKGSTKFLTRKELKEEITDIELKTLEILMRDIYLKLPKNSLRKNNLSKKEIAEILNMSEFTYVRYLDNLKLITKIEELEKLIKNPLKKNNYNIDNGVVETKVSEKNETTKTLNELVKVVKEMKVEINLLFDLLKSQRQPITLNRVYTDYFLTDYEARGYRINSGVAFKFSTYLKANKVQGQASLSQAVFQFLLQNDKNFENEILELDQIQEKEKGTPKKSNSWRT